MSVDVILITTGSRPALLKQSLRSLSENKHDHSTFSLRIVWDCQFNQVQQPSEEMHHLLISYGDVITLRQSGASRARNIGAGSIPRYRRQQWIMFCDDDCYFTRDWDRKLLELAELLPRAIISGHNHPYNNCVSRVSSFGLKWDEPLVISTVNMLMGWEIFDEVGPFDEPGGSGGSEDYALCMRAQKKGYGFAVTHEQCILHTGITSSNGTPIIGADLVKGNNARLEKLYGLEGKVVCG